MSKKLIAKILTIAILIVIALPLTTVFATNNCGGAHNIYIHDLANLLSSTEESELRELAEYFCEGNDLNVLFLTTYNTNGKSTMVYSDDYMDKLFPEGVENNIAFVIDMQNREYYINTMGIAIEKLGDYKIEKALDKGWNGMKSGDYAEAFEDMATYCLSDITGKSSIMIGGFFAGLGALMLSNALFALVPTTIVVIWLVAKHNAANKTQSAGKYLSNENYTILNKDEVFVRSYDTVQRDYYKPSSSSGSSGGSSHRSSSGRSHGGGGRRF